MCICTNKESKEKKGTCKHTGSGAASTCSCNCDDCLDCRGNSCKKNCKPAAGNLSICKASQGNTLTVGQRDQVSAHFNCGYAGNRRIGWRSSNPNVVKVDCYGNLTAVGEGYACIYAYVYGNSSVYDRITIHVTANGSSSGSSGSGSSGSSGSGSSGSGSSSSGSSGGNENPGTSGGLSGSEGGNTPTAGASYKFICQNGSGKVLSLRTSDLRAGMQLTLRKDLGSSSQTFVYESYEGGHILRIRKNTAYVVNRNSGNNNAIVWSWSTDADTVNDSLVEFEPVMNGVYRIKLTKRGLYLTAGNDEMDPKVKWMTQDPANAGQEWLCVPNEDLEPGVYNAVELTMPVNLNQYYEKVNDKNVKDDKDKIWIEDTGCCACAIGNVLSYYDNHEYTILELLANGNAIKKSDKKGYYTQGAWGSNTVGFGEYTIVENEGELLDLIKEELSSDHPVILHCKGIDPAQHWVVAYKYTNGDQSISDQLRDNIWVLDSANKAHPESDEGERKTLAKSMISNACNRVKAYKTTWKK